ncbi:pyruvate dehydrogenase (acetyl-transferring) E1 component subunit alpha [Candidatus Micrarchaeota archaeon]|nr:pyruvate dehydrogenase (acetyl-transferring) E1 component subunit alpha [Candidatus Micrarchaeota archaeon]
MPITKAFEGKIDYVQILDKDGNIDQTLDPKLPDELLDKLYRFMVLARTWDKKCLALQRTGRMYTYAPLEGQEAIIVGAALALNKEDWIFPTYRESFLYHIRGAELWKINLGWMGMEDGLKLDKSMHCFPLAIPIATQFPHSVGAAYALKQKGIKAATLSFGGDGSTSEGDFHDALNFAGVLNTPSVFLVSNNGFAISVPRKWQTKSETIAQKALAYGIKGVQIDGNDVLCVYSTIKRALDMARDGKGQMLIEAVTYRMGPHTTADDPKKYRNEEEVAYWRERDPIKRFQLYLKGRGLWSMEYEQRILEESSKLVEDAVAKSEAYQPDPKEIFRYVFANMTPDLEEQMQQCFEKK